LKIHINTLVDRAIAEEENRIIPPDILQRDTTPHP